MLRQILDQRRGRMVLACLLLAAGTAHAQHKSLHDRLVDIDEVSRVTAQSAQHELARLQPEVKDAAPADQALYLIVSSDIQHRFGNHAQAVALSDQALAIGYRIADNDTIANALLSKAYAQFSLGKTAESHQMVWKAEQLTEKTKDLKLRVNALISSGEAYAEDGDFPRALGKIQKANVMARQSRNSLLTVISSRSLAWLYDQMHEYDKGFEILDEGMKAAREVDNPDGRLAMLKSTEYALAMDSGQTERALKAELSALALQRKLGAAPMVGVSLVNLADCYLNLHDYPNALSYAQQALAQAQALNDDRLAATAQINTGHAYLGMGRLAEGKASIQTGLAWYEKVGNKPELQAVLFEYGTALERVGDLAGALNAYHRERLLSNELFEARRQKAMVTLQEQYAAEKRLREIELLRKENAINSAELVNRRLQQRIWWLLAITFALTAGIVGLLYRKVRHANFSLEEKNRELKHQSTRDPLTALYNRRHFQEFMSDRQQPTGGMGGGDEAVSALFLLDVDHFKHINDTYGHGGGDVVLRGIAVSLREILRETDMIVRWGGEEFLAFLPSVPRSQLDEVALRILHGIQQRRFDHNGMQLSVQVSIGFAPFPLADGDEAMSWERAVNLVDMALYMAKSHGRNRAYGIRSVAKGSIDDIEADMEEAARAGKVKLSVVLGNQVKLRVIS